MFTPADSNLERGWPGRIDGDVVVLQPYEQGDGGLAHTLTGDPHVITTVSRLDDLRVLAAGAGRPRVLIEVLTTMRRHGLSEADLVAAGPLGTLAARSIPGFEGLADLWRTQAPLGWDIEDPAPVADAICFLLSDLARGISGEILHVDGGFHAVGAPAVVLADSSRAARRGRRRTTPR